MKDPSVPVKWRLYGIINGYWLSGRTVFAGNEYFAAELGCSERHISRALQELEKDGLLSRNVQGFKRTILPRVTPDVRLGRRPVSREGDAPGHHISISNSTSKKEASKKKLPLNRKGMEYEYNLDPETGEPLSNRKRGAIKKEGKNKIAMRIQRKFSDMVLEKFGFRPVMDVKTYKIALFAMNSGELTEEQIYDLFDEWFGLGKRDDDLVQMTQALSGNNINRYKAKNL